MQKRWSYKKATATDASRETNWKDKLKENNILSTKSRQRFKGSRRYQ